MEATQLLSLNFSLEINQKDLPKNIYGLKLVNEKTNETISLFINHNGLCPDIYSEREQSNYNDFLSNLETSIINEYCKLNNIKNSDLLSRKLEIMTNENGELYHYSRTAN
ncbi:hypothetical protein JE950_002412 [Flavobacterium psychrophilum]|nr:hypothetical protein [Flavobacterium psychrophilum]